jgi:glutaredoxin
MRQVTLYTRMGCHLCEQAREVIERARRRVDFELQVLDIDDDEALRARYHQDVPVVAIDGRDLFWWKVDEDALVSRLAK